MKCGYDAYFILIFQLFISPGTDESASILITDSSGNMMDAEAPTNTRFSHTIRVPSGQPGVTVYHWNGTVPQTTTFQVAGMGG